jgi:uncharacterized protein (DUF1499 family)
MIHRSRLAWLAAAVALLAALPAWWLVALSRRRPEVGLVHRELRSCPPTPNCVCSTASDAGHHVAPLHFGDAPAAAWERLLRVLADHPQARVVAQTRDYVHAEFRTPWLGFVDDVELLLDAEQSVIHVRSASRVGKSDLGVNRLRVEELRRRFAAAGD